MKRYHLPRVPKTILLTGFGPFLKFRVNSSWEAIRHLDGAQRRGFRIVARRLPVSYRQAAPMLRRWLREIRPAAVASFGLADDRAIRLERIALNVDHTLKPDNDGDKPYDRRILPRGSLALESRLPLRAIERRLRRARIPVRLSFHAGTYLCNHVFYTLLAVCRVPAGFIHLPPLKRLPLRKLRRAVMLILDVLTDRRFLR